MTHSPPALRELLARAGANPRRSLGQNFVVDPNTVRRIAALAGVGPDHKVIEIGAGLGSLTLALVETGATVVAVETDPALVPVLREVVGDDATVVEADVRELDWEQVLGGDGWDLVANLPYNIATRLVIDVLDEVPQVERLLVMVQREAGERLVAAAGSKAYGAVSVRVALRADARIVGTVPPTVFHPQPKVTSVLVALERTERLVPKVIEEELVSLLREAFGQRRKMLRRSIGSRIQSDEFELAGVRPDQRPEELDVDTWCRLATAVCQRGSP